MKKKKKRIDCPSVCQSTYLSCPDAFMSELLVPKTNKQTSERAGPTFNPEIFHYDKVFFRNFGSRYVGKMPNRYIIHSPVKTIAARVLLGYRSVAAFIPTVSPLPCRLFSASVVVNTFNRLKQNLLDY